MKITRLCFSALAAVLFVFSSQASADFVIVDFTAPGALNVTTAGLEVQTVTEPVTGVSFTVTASDVTVNNTNSGGLTTRNNGLGSNARNNGTFLNLIGGESEIIQFTLSGVTGLAPNQSIILSDLLSQNARSIAADQSGGLGGTFGNVAGDDVVLTSDLGNTFRIFQSDTGDLGSILLNANDTSSTDPIGNTFAHSANDFEFNNSFTISLTANDAVEIQGLRFAVVTAAVPEPTSTALLGLGALGFVLRRRRN